MVAERHESRESQGNAQYLMQRQWPEVERFAASRIEPPGLPHLRLFGI